jgi:hypothetical protein
MTSFAGIIPIRFKGYLSQSRSYERNTPVIIFCKRVRALIVPLMFCDYVSCMDDARQKSAQGQDNVDPEMFA